MCVIQVYFTDWVDVANDLLSKCHINLRLRKVTDCDANVFVALYQAILGEKVPGEFTLKRRARHAFWNLSTVLCLCFEDS